MSATIYEQGEWLRLLVERFGESPMGWAFVCPTCGDVATGADFRQALMVHPRTGRNGEPRMASDVLGQECIGRSLGALEQRQGAWDARRKAGEVRGCDWCSYGLFRGPDSVICPEEGIQPDGTRSGQTKTVYVFAMAPVIAESSTRPSTSARRSNHG